MLVVDGTRKPPRSRSTWAALLITPPCLIFVLLALAPFAPEVKLGTPGSSLFARCLDANQWPQIFTPYGVSYGQDFDDQRIVTLKLRIADWLYEIGYSRVPIR
jgi:hypothetical protein